VLPPTRRHRLWPRVVGLTALSTGWIFLVFVIGLAGSEGSASTAPGLYVLLGLGLLGAASIAYPSIRRSGAPRGSSAVTALAMGFMAYVAAFVTAAVALWALVTFS